MSDEDSITCPNCGCTPEEGFDVYREHVESGDKYIKTIYLCPKCNKKSIREYRFVRWSFK